MDKRVLIRRGTEILAGFLIVGSIGIYTSARIQNAGNDMVSIAGTESNDDKNTFQINTHLEKSPESIVSAGTYNPSIVSNEDVQAFALVDPTTDAQKVAKPTDTTAAVTPVAEPVYKYVHANELNVRSGPGAEHDKLATLDRGSRVQALNQSGSWLEVITQDDVNGFILAEYAADTLPPTYKYVVANYLNVRSGPNPETDKLDMLKQGTRVQVLEIKDDWLSILTPDSVKGYVLAEYTSESPPPVYNYINANQLNVRKSPSAEAAKLATLTTGERVQLLENQGEWAKVVTKSNVEGYILSKYMVQSEKLVSRSTTAQSHNADKAAQILEYAKKFVGVKYVYGASSPTGFDCSGFTKYVFAKFNITLPRSSEDYDTVGSKVARTDLKPGDILLYDVYDDWQLGHVGIYMGNDQFIHASTSKGKVVIASFSKYNGNLLGIRRVIK